MLDAQTPGWLKWLEKRMGWLAVPNIAILLVTLQAAGFLFVLMDGAWFSNLALVPQAVLQGGQYWRLITWLALPASMSPIFMLFGLWFFYFVCNLIENEWGAFKTTFYILISMLIAITYSLTTGYPIAEATRFQSTLFLAAAALFPDMQVSLFMVFPVKVKWLAWFTLALLALEFARTGWLERFYIIAIFSNCLIFFGPALINDLRQRARRRAYRKKLDP